MRYELSLQHGVVSTERREYTIIMAPALRPGHRCAHFLAPASLCVACATTVAGKTEARLVSANAYTPPTLAQPHRSDVFCTGC